MPRRIKFTEKKKVLLDEFTFRKAATLHARSDNANPFAFSRMMLHMKQGLALPSDVIADATSRLEARGQKATYLD